LVFKRARVVNGTVNMGFGGEVDHPQRPMLPEKSVYAVPVADVAFLKSKAGILCNGFQAAQVAGVGELIQNHDLEFGFRQRQSDEVAPNEACTACHQNRIHASGPFSVRIE
jgi:hypothetical protein